MEDRGAPWQGVEVTEVCQRQASLAGLYKVKYPDRLHFEMHALLPTNYGADSRWVLLEKPGTVR